MSGFRVDYERCMNNHFNSTKNIFCESAECTHDRICCPFCLKEHHSMHRYTPLEKILLDIRDTL